MTDRIIRYKRGFLNLSCNPQLRKPLLIRKSNPDQSIGIECNTQTFFHWVGRAPEGKIIHQLPGTSYY